MICHCEEVKPVYCENCKWVESTTIKRDMNGGGYISCHEWERCNIKNTKQVSTNYGGLEAIYNKNNNCPDYKRKWWKIWLK